MSTINARWPCQHPDISLRRQLPKIMKLDLGVHFFDQTDGLRLDYKQTALSSLLPPLMGWTVLISWALLSVLCLGQTIDDPCFCDPRRFGVEDSYGYFFISQQNERFSQQIEQIILYFSCFSPVTCSFFVDPLPEYSVRLLVDEFDEWADYCSDIDLYLYDYSNDTSQQLFIKRYVFIFLFRKLLFQNYVLGHLSTIFYLLIFE